VCTGTTGHAEAIKIAYNPEIITYCNLLEVFFGTHDPITPNRQGNDIGEQYRSVIFYADDGQRQEAEKFIEELETNGTFDSSIITQVQPVEKFYEAEDCHKNYFEKNPDKPYCQVIINPKIAKLRQKFAGMLKS
jgi:peptide-methionine (S)-S-oxide reductase